jgi:hypothetical protein
MKTEPREITMNVPVKIEITKLTIDVYQNYPEASWSFQCTEWQYGNEDSNRPFVFNFYDHGEDKTHTVNLEQAEKGVIKLIELWLQGKYHFCGISNINDLLDPCNWDAEILDAATQCAIFNEVIYG